MSAVISLQVQQATPQNLIAKSWKNIPTALLRESDEDSFGRAGGKAPEIFIKEPLVQRAPLQAGAAIASKGGVNSKLPLQHDLGFHSKQCQK